MKKVLLLNGGKKFAHSDGRYNATLHDAAVARYEQHLAQVFNLSV
jgi:modulator of drug activity B